MCVGASGFQPRIDIWHRLVFLATGFQSGHEPLTTCDSTEHSQLLLVHLIKNDFTFKNLFSIAMFENQGVHMHMHPDGPKVVCPKIGGAPQPSGCAVNPMVW